MTKLLINKQHGGYGLSRTAVERLRNLGHPGAIAETLPGETYPDGSGPAEALPGHWGSYSCREISRNDPQLLAVVAELGNEANGSAARLAVVEIPDDVEWQIEEYDGREWVAEKHRIWGYEE